MLNKISIYSLTLEELTKQIIALGLKKHNAIQIFQWIYQKNIIDFSKMSNIAKDAKLILDKHFVFNRFSIEKQLVDDKDETTKFLFKLHDNQLIESVLMKFDYGYSLCISSQVGCNMGCKFCASGLLQKKRDLTVDEIILQFVHAQEYLHKLNKERISNIVVMGIGEPFDNYDNLCNAINILINHYGIAMGSRHITISTCGLVPKIVTFASAFPQINLAISLHAPNDIIRNKLMPINKAYNIDTLMKSINKYLQITKNRISFQYILLDGVNDSDECAHELGKLLKGIFCYVNIIVYNNVKENTFKPSNKYKRFIDILSTYKILATKRLERGSQIDAACGQLRAKHLS